MDRSFLFLPMVAALTLAACDTREAAVPGASGAGTSAPASQTGTATAAPASDAAAMWNGGNARALSAQVAHPSGVVVQLTSIQSQPTSTSVGIRVVNNAGREVKMNAWPRQQKGYILLDSGERLFLSVPSTNPELAIPDKQTFEGTLAFVGRLPPVRTATLILNDGSSDGEHTSSPTFRFTLPVGPDAPAPAPQPSADAAPTTAPAPAPAS